MLQQSSAASATRSRRERRITRNDLRDGWLARNLIGSVIKCVRESLSENTDEKCEKLILAEYA